MKPGDPFVIELCMSIEVDPDEAPHPSDWDLPGMFNAIPGLTVCDATFQVIDLDDEVIQ
jgi:hypothetical protein